MRAVTSTVGVLLTLVSLCTGPSRAEDDVAQPRALPWEETLDLGPWKPVRVSTLREVEARVARLAGITHVHGGLTVWSAGGPSSEGVLPPGARAAREADDADEAFRELVRSGPDAMPALLAHLDDATPTRMKVGRGGLMDNVSAGTEVDVNPDDPDEVGRVRSVLAAPRSRQARVDEHVVTVGDVCFAILGQVTNRAYQAVRAQPSACVVINSPTHEPRLARAVRAAWEGTELRRELARRLLLDLGRASKRYQGGAALRLAFYFPDASEGVLARTLDLIETPAMPEALVGHARLAAAAAIADRPALREPLRRLALRTEQADVLLAALAGLPDDRSRAVRDRVLRMWVRSRGAEGSARAASALERVVRRRWPGAMGSTSEAGGRR